MSFILAVDVGNTRAKYGVFEVASAALPQVVGISATPLTSDISLAAELEEWLETNGFDEIDGCIVAGSNPPHRDALMDDWRLQGSVPTIIHHFNQIPISICVDQPETVGIDRLLTAFATRKLVSDSQPIVVIDSGTATTVNLTTSDGTFRGGAILPGLRLSALALHEYTARLPLIDTDILTADDVAEVCVPVPGRNTIDAMKAGLFWGQLGAVKEIAARLEREATERFGETLPAVTVLTGGGGRQLVTQLPNAIYIDCLALHGMAMIHAAG